MVAHRCVALTSTGVIVPAHPVVFLENDDQCSGLGGDWLQCLKRGLFLVILGLMIISDSRHIAVVAQALPQTIYDIARDLFRLPEWAAGLAAGNLQVMDENTVELDSPMGRVRTVFLPRNQLGVLDHRVILPDGTTVDNPLRLVVHPAGTDIIFTVRQGSASNADFEADCLAVRADLERLARLAEKSAESEE